MVMWYKGIMVNYTNYLSNILPKYILNIILHNHHDNGTWNVYEHNYL